MLDVLRRNAGSWAIKIILTFIALTFIWWGVGTYSERGRNVAASVGGETITMNELANTVSGLEKTYRNVYGAAFTPELEKALNLKKQAMDTLIRRKLLLEEAAKMGITATDGEVRREIAATPAFQADGRFRDDRYRSVLSFNRVTPAEYEESKRTEITIRKMEGLLAAGALVPETEAKELFRLYFRRIRLLVVTAAPADMKASPPAEAEIAAKYAQSKESYRIPARVKLDLAVFTPERFGRDTHPSEAEIKAFYEGNPDRFRTAEERLVSRIVLPFGKKDKAEVRRKAEKILREAAKGKAQFEAAARKFSRGKPGEAWITRKEAGPALSEPVFSASVDAVVGPVELQDGFVLARVNRIRFPEAEPLSKVRDQVVSLLRAEKGKDQAVVKAYEAQRKASEGKDLKKVAASFGVPVTETEWVGADGGPEVPPSVAQDALLLPRGDVGPVKAVGDAQYLFQVAAKEESRVPPLSDVRDKVAAAVTREKEVAAARAELMRLLSTARTAAELEAGAKKDGLGTSVSGWFAPLSEPVPEALGNAGDLRKDLATLTAKAPVSQKIFQGKEGRVSGVAFLGEELPGDAEWAKQKTSFLRGIDEQKKNAMMEAFLSDRRKRTKVEINPEALK